MSTPSPLFSDAAEAGAATPLFVRPTFSPAATPAPAPAPTLVQALAIGTDLLPATAPATVPTAAHEVAAEIVPADLLKRIQTLDAQGSTGVSEVSRQILEATKASDAGALGDLLNQLVQTAKGLDPQAVPAGLLGRFFHKAQISKDQLLSHYQTVQQRMGTLADQVQQRCDRETQRIGELEHMEVANLQVIAERTAALQVFETAQAQAQAALDALDKTAQRAAATDFAIARQRTDAQALVDYAADRADNCRRVILLAKQRAPQIRIMIDNARSLVQKFADVKSTVIPAWSDRLALYIAQMDQKHAAELANAIFDASDQALRAQADALKQGTQEVTALRSRTVASTDALTYANTQLLSTLDDLNTAAQAERQARVDAQKKLQELESQLVQRLVAPQERGVLLPRSPAA